MLGKDRRGIHTGTSAEHACHRHVHVKCADSCSECTDSCSECAGNQVSSAGSGVDFESNYLGAGSQTQHLQEGPRSSDLPSRTETPTKQQVESVMAAADTVASALEVQNLLSSAVPATQELPVSKVLHSGI